LIDWVIGPVMAVATAGSAVVLPPGQVCPPPAIVQSVTTAPP